jgi:hypothetical protein
MDPEGAVPTSLAMSPVNLRGETPAPERDWNFCPATVEDGRPHRRAVGENPWITGDHAVKRGRLLNAPGPPLPLKGAEVAAHTVEANEVIDSFPLTEQGPLSLIKFFAIMALSWDLSR